MAEKEALDDRLLARLAEIAKMESTVDLTKRDSYIASAGWNVDAREILLPAEQPGSPEPDGSFEIAKGILTDYTFPPPQLIRGRFDPSVPLDGRGMLLTAAFLWMRFDLPVRVSRVIDEARVGPNGDERIWGYSYQTLSGHIERGEITFEIKKLLASGEVQFRIHSFSQTGHIANPFYRLGFRIVGRRLQARFALESLRNMERLVIAARLRQTLIAV